jgi:hypothetical protein
MKPKLRQSTKPAWVQLYEARRPAPPPRTRTRGRPPRVTPRKATVFHLTDGERAEINAWQARLSPLLGRKISLGETAGILARLASARLARFPEEPQFQSLADLARAIVGDEEL